MAKEQTLETLSVVLAEELLTRIQNGDAGAAELNVARQLLRDNNIVVSPKMEHPAHKLGLVLPFEEPQSKEASNG